MQLTPRLRTVSDTRKMSLGRGRSLSASLILASCLLSGAKPDNVWLVSVQLKTVAAAPQFNVSDAVSHCGLPCMDLVDQHVFTELRVVSKPMKWYSTAGDNFLHLCSVHTVNFKGPKDEPCGSPQSWSTTFDSLQSLLDRIVPTGWFCASSMRHRWFWIEFGEYPAVLNVRQYHTLLTGLIYYPVPIFSRPKSPNVHGYY